MSHTRQLEGSTEAAFLPTASRGKRLLFLAAAFVPLLVLLAWQAVRTYWQCDDAYISYRYVRNFVEGHGLVFNRGERVEGYTNFLWVLNLSALWKAFGLGPEVGSSILSGLYTAGSLLVTFLLARGGPFPERRLFVAWGSLLLLAVSHTWAIWSTSGLETRQFTFFVLLSIYLVSTYPRGRSRLVWASLALAACEYSRPEGSLIFGACCAWLVLDSLFHDRFRWRALLALVLPCAVLIGLHFLWRRSYYGEWLPNTYYAKYVGPWPEAGFSYMALATCELGLYLLFPAALLGGLVRLARGDWTHVLSFACILPHAAYLIRIGGDHFEFRVLDFYWPLLAVAAVEGLLALARWTAQLVRAPAERSVFFADVAALVLLCVLAVYTSAVQTAKELVTADLKTREETLRLQVRIRPEDFPALFLLPGMTSLVEDYNALHDYCAPHGLAVPYAEHRVFWQQELVWWAPYEALHGSGLLPPDAVASLPCIGVSGYHLSALTIIDSKGLTDHYVARMPTGKPNYVGHDRRADRAYLMKRGYNLMLKRAVRSAQEALIDSNYALRIRDDVWMPFDSADSSWVERAFRNGQEVRTWVVDQSVGCFADGDLANWTVEGSAFAEQPRTERRERSIHIPIRRCAGLMQIDTRGATKSEARTGRALSPPFRVPPGGTIEFWLGGTKDDRVGVRLLDQEKVVREWRALRPDVYVPERFELRRFEGRELRLLVFDDSGEEGGSIQVADVVVLVPGLVKGP